MTALERIVRPFQTGDIRPGAIATGNPQLPGDAIVLEFGREGSTQTFTSSISSQSSSYSEIQHWEVERTVQEVRIEDPEDPLNANNAQQGAHVNVDVVTNIKTADKEGETYTESNQKLAPLPAGTIVNGNERVIKTERPPGGW